MMQLDVTKCDYDVTRCDRIIQGLFFSLKMLKLTWARLINNIS